MEHIHVCVIQTDLLNYIVKSLNLDCVPALTNVNVSKLSWKLEDMKLIASISQFCQRKESKHKINCLGNESQSIASVIKIMQSRVLATDCPLPSDCESEKLRPL